MGNKRLYYGGNFIKKYNDINMVIKNEEINIIIINFCLGVKN